MLKPVALLNSRSSSPQRDPQVAAEWLIESKLEPPQQRVTAVRREHLLQRMDAALDLPLTLLLAPPGFGKTTLLAQWQQRLRQRGDVGVGWLSLDEDDNDIGHFAAYAGLALSRAGAAPGAGLQTLMSRWQSVDAHSAAAALIATVRNAPHKLVLILDDYDRACGGAIDELLTRLIEHAGPRLHLLLATRRGTALPLSRLAVRGGLQRIGAQELSLSEDETRALLGADVPAHTANELRQRTEGWPVALHLASLWLEGSARQPAQTAPFSGRWTGIAAYLAEQVLDQLDPPLREFLLQTSVLERFGPALADSVRGADDSGALLARLEHFHGLLVPLDGEHEWFRYHPLFADYLRQQLERTQPGWPILAHRRAAKWFHARGHLAEAVRHAARAGETALAAGYIAEAGTWQLLMRYGPSRVRAMLREFDPATVRRLPALNLTQAYLHMKLGEFGHARLLLEQYRDLPDEQRAPLQRDYTVVAALMRDLLDEISANPRGAAQIAAQTEALDADDHSGRGILLCIGASIALGRGEFAAAEARARDGERQMRQAGSELGAHYASILVGQSLFQRGRLDEAAAIYQQALAAGERLRGAGEMLCSASRCLLARLQCERGRYDEAADLLHPALSYIERHDGRFDSYVAGYETALALSRVSDRSGRATFELLDRIDAFARQRQLSRLTQLAVAWRIQAAVEQAHGDTPPPQLGLLIADSGAEASFAHAGEHRQHWRQRIVLGFALAQWHALSGRSGAALDLLRAVESDCIEADAQCLLARARARIALALQQRGQIEAALPYLRSVLDYTSRSRAWQAVVELGLPAKAMLRLGRQHDPESGTGSTRALTIQTLLDKLEDGDAPDDDAFSVREREVLVLLAQGGSNKQIARRLHLSENTVKFHLKNLYRKLDAGSRDAALSAALRRGLVRPGATWSSAATQH